MTAYQLFRGLTAWTGSCWRRQSWWIPGRNPPQRNCPQRKIWLVAAVIALALLLVGCAVAYALTVFGQSRGDDRRSVRRADSAAPFEDSDPDGRTPLGLFRGMKNLPWRKPLLRSFKSGFPL